MRMSCNGCRVLRKGCTEDCTLRPCLQWIKTPESQANATVFLAKFYGRAGLVNLINAGPDHLRPAIFRSLLYEACGRIINPIYGSVGLMWGGNWDRCQEAVEAVLSGSEITKIPIEDGGGAEPHSIPPFKGCDIRHISKEASPAVRRVKTRNRFKRTGLAEGSSAAGNVDSLADAMEEPEKFSISGWGFDGSDGGRFERAASHGSSSLELAEPYGLGEEKPVGTGNELMLDLTLGFGAGDQATNPPWMSTQ